jgi:hypothetical protein
MFVQYLTGEAQNMTKLERKPRRNIQYKDMGKTLRKVFLPCQVF